jgi:release factor glutamine methyltransferase
MPEAAPTPATLRDVLALGTAMLAAAGVDGPQRDARILAAYGLGLSPLDLIRAPDRPVSTTEAAAATALFRRRASREPVSRILGTRDFYGRTFELDASTLDPRPDSETLIDAVLATVRRAGLAERPLRLLDVGTGSGCLLLTLLAELPNATGAGSDISQAALERARSNAGRLGVAQRAAWLEGRSLEPFGGSFDILVSNPPYIPSADIAALDPEVRCFDPVTALDGGADGLAVYRELAARIPDVIPTGWIFLEIGAAQAQAVTELLAGIGATAIEIHCDLAGRPRCVAAQTRQ